MDADSSLDCASAGEIHSSVGAGYGNVVVIGALSRLPSEGRKLRQTIRSKAGFTGY
jgi:hypothetical protein